jgi:NADH-quinone oxidoreductase subunit J
MTMSIQSLIFFLFAGLLIVAALMTVLSRNPVRCALSLVLAFFAVAGLWILLTAEFLGLVLILVYVGAVMTLFLFVIMTLNLEIAEGQKRFTPYWPYVLITAVLLLAVLCYVLGSDTAFSNWHLASFSPHNTQDLGDILYTRYAYPFEIVGVLLLVAIIATIALSAKTKRLNKSIAPETQIHVTKAERLQIIKMEAQQKK